MGLCHRTARVRLFTISPLARALLTIFTCVFSTTCAARADFSMYVSDWAHDRVYRLNATTGQWDTLITDGSGGLDNPAGMSVGPGGALLVSSGATNTVLKYDSTTGQPGGFFTTSVPTPILMQPRSDGFQYIAARGGTSGVYRSNGTGSAELFATTDSSNLFWAYDVDFLPDGDLLVSSFMRGSILRFDGLTGAYEGPFSQPTTGNAAGIAWGPDGNLYVARYASNRIDRINGLTGAPMGGFATGNGMNKPSDLVFGTDGNLYVGNERSPLISVFNAATGGAVGTIPMPDNTALTGVGGMIPVPEPSSAALAGLVVLLATTRVRHRSETADRVARKE